MPDSEVTSIEQDEWISITENVRKNLVKQLEYMPAMTPVEVGSFINALQSACWFEQQAQLYDKNLNDSKKRMWTD